MFPKPCNYCKLCMTRVKKLGKVFLNLIEINFALEKWRFRKTKLKLAFFKNKGCILDCIQYR
jgi:hypothetical protein